MKKESIFSVLISVAMLAGAEQVITWPAGVADLPSAGMIYNTANEDVVLDGRGAVVGKMDTTTTYVKEPLKLKSEGVVIFDVESYWGDSTKQTTLPFIWSDFYVRLIHDAAAPQVHIDGGTLDIDPLNTGTRKTFLFGTYKDSKPLALYVHGGNIRFTPFLFSVTPLTDIKLRFDGGAHTQVLAKASVAEHDKYNNMAYNNGGTDVEGRTASMEVANPGTEFVFESETRMGLAGFPNRTFTFLAEDGGLLRFNALKIQEVGTHILKVKNGGVMEFNAYTDLGDSGRGILRMIGEGGIYRTTDTGTLAIGGGNGYVYGALTNCTLSARSLTLYWNVDFEMLGGELKSLGTGAISLGSSKTDETRHGTFTARGTKLNLEPSSTLYVSCGTTASLLDSFGTLDTVWIGRTQSSELSTLNLSGAITNNNYFLVGLDAPGEVNFTGGTHVIRACGTSPRSSCKTAEIGNNSYGCVKVTGGAEVFWGTSSEMYLGNNDNSTGQVDVVNGSFHLGSSSFKSVGTYSASRERATGIINVYDEGVFYCEASTLQVPRGNFAFTQYGGKVYGDKLRLGTFGKDSVGGTTMRYEIRGGYAQWKGYISVIENGNYTGEVVMTGGTLETAQISGGGASACKGGAGHSALKVNGGTIKAMNDNAIFITQFDLVEVGANGFILDTAGHNVTIAAQNFTAAAGGGKIIKRGAGTLTITGEVDDQIDVIVEGGRVVFAGSSKMAGALTIKGNGSVMFDTSAAISLAALTIGDETTTGALEFGNNTTDITVRGAVTIQNDMSSRDLICNEAGGSTSVTVDTTPARNLFITLDSGTSNATADVSFRGVDTLTAVVAKDARLFLDGRYARGAFVKQGGGAATLTGSDNTFLGGVTLAEGLLSATTLSGLGFDFATSPAFVQQGGTLELADGGDFPATVTVNAASKTAAVVVKNDADVTVKKEFTLTNGALFKRGAGTLRFETPATLAVDNGVDPITRTVQSFDDNGTVPTTGYAGFNVVEGEVVLADNTYRIDKSGYVGLRTAQAPAAKPTLTFTNATVSLNGSGANMFFIGSCVTATDPEQEFALNIIDSKVTGNTPLCVGGYNGCAATSPTSRVDVVMRNSTITAAYGVWLNENQSGGKAYWTIDNSRFYGKQNCRSMGYSAVEFVNGSVYASSSALDGAPLPEVRNLNDADGGYLRFNEGTDAYVDKLGGQGGYYRIKLCFNGGAWHPGPCPMLRWAAGYNPALTQVVLEEKGVVLPIASGTCRNTIRLEGEGGLVKTGAGELFFDTGSTWDTWTDKANPREQKLTAALGGIDTWRFTGEAEVREGALSVAAGAASGAVKACVAAGATFALKEGCVLEGAVLRGGGTVTGGTLKNATVAVGDEVLTIASAVDGRLWLDFGRTEDDPLPYPQRAVVAKWSGTKPDVSTWRVKGSGTKGVKGVCTALDDGTVVADIDRFGTLLIVR